MNKIFAVEREIVFKKPVEGIESCELCGKPLRIAVSGLVIFEVGSLKLLPNDRVLSSSETNLPPDYEKMFGDFLENPTIVDTAFRNQLCPNSTDGKHHPVILP